MAEFVELTQLDEEEFAKKYFHDVDSGLSNHTKLIPMKYLYDEQGSTLYSQLNFQ